MSDLNNINTTETPWHLWFVGILALVWNAMGAMDYLLTQTKNEDYLSNFSPEQLLFFSEFPFWVVFAWATAVWGGVVGSILLLFRSRIATSIFLLSLIAMLITTFHNYVLSNGLQIAGDTFSLILTATIFIVAVFLFLYSLLMKNRGLLN